MSTVSAVPVPPEGLLWPALPGRPSQLCCVVYSPVRPHMLPGLVAVPALSHGLGTDVQQDLALCSPFGANLSFCAPLEASLGADASWCQFPASNSGGFSSQGRGCCCCWENSISCRLPAPQTRLFLPSPAQFTASFRLGKTSEIRSNL